MSGLYIHIPFCATKCSYCDFYSMPLKGKNIAEEYVIALIKEFNLRRPELPEKIKTVYIGGGTPSQIPIDTLKRLVQGISDNDCQLLDEFTIEANPEDITKQWTDTIASLGINRVSIGIQSFIDSELSAIGRRHDSLKAIEAISTLRDSGITEISGDLIYGLPGQTEESWAISLDRIFNLNLPHISAYSLSYEPRTRLSAMLQAGKIKPTDEESCIEMYKTLIKRMRENGYEHYEISNFALPGHRAIHNSGYWNFTPYLGLGPGAHSFDGKKRSNNPPNLKKYLKKLSEDNTAYEEDDESEEDLTNDYIITSLRKAEGINLDEMENITGKRSAMRLLNDATPFVKSGKLKIEKHNLKFTEESWLVSDMILRELLQ